MRPLTIGELIEGGVGGWDTLVWLSMPEDGVSP